MKAVTTDRPVKYEPGEFFQISNKGLKAAASLNNNGLLLWLYLCKFKNGTKWKISPQAISNELGITLDKAKKVSTIGYQELVAANFIRDDIFYADG